MHILLLALLLQQTPNSQKVAIPHAPRTVLKPSAAKEQSTPQLKNPLSATTPELDQNSPPTPYEMGKVIGGQNQAISDLRTTVQSLEEKRDYHDRPDIDSLEGSRFHLRLLFTLIAIALGVLWWAKGFIWKDSILPRLRKSLNDSSKPPSSDAPPPAS